MTFIILASLFLIFIDQISKYFVVTQMELYQSIELINNFFSLTSHRNKGAAWGILQDSRVFFIVVTTIFLLTICFYIYKNKTKLSIIDKILFSLILGGAIGNFIDRLLRAEVVDFFDFNLFGYNFPIFNFADIFICIGVFLLVIKIYRED